jgi:hypothetical protein
MVAAALLFVTAVVGGLSLPWSSGFVRRMVFGVAQAVLLAAAALLVVVLPPRDAVSEVVLDIAALLAAVLGGGVVRAVLGIAARMGGRNAEAALPFSAWIGVVERFAFALAILLGVAEISAAVVAVKGLGVYAQSRGDDNRVAATRVLGSLASFGWALGCAGVVLIAHHLVP